MIIVYLSGKMTGLEESEYTENFRNAEMFYKAIGGRNEAFFFLRGSAYHSYNVVIRD